MTSTGPSAASGVNINCGAGQYADGVRSSLAVSGSGLRRPTAAPVATTAAATSSAVVTDVRSATTPQITAPSAWAPWNTTR